MCYSFKSKLSTQKKRYQHWKKVWKEEAEIIDDKGKDLFFADGFSHPTVLIYTTAKPFVPTPSLWGLIPSWANDTKIGNQTLNARGETLFEKPAFRESAKSKRCLIYVDGFFEYHHFRGKTYPYFIFNKDESPMVLAGLWSEWDDKATGTLLNTFSIVTTSGNPMMSRIHNNPKADGPRMPLILSEDVADEWLKPIHSKADEQYIASIIQPYNQDKMDSYTVGTLKGKNAIGNNPESTHRVGYPELEFNQSSLF
ncbi:SOS response-associated peptidase [Mangrovibacterium sp.]|uniref:SOS response-associated peptidase n=1 Tax=Mangrovibacterium sp. TaxID=1961364 RepID=UPI0035645146